jgi:hypothetical protein
MKIKLLLASFLFGFGLNQNVFATVFDVPLGVEWIQQINTLSPGTSSRVYNLLKVNASGGDTLLIEGGTRTPMRFDNLLGDSLNPLVICNKDAQVIITKPVGGYFGMAFNACRYIKLSGNNNASVVYGIKITQIPGGSGLSINNFSSNFEVERVEVGNVYSSGIVAKTDPSCANVLTYVNFVMYDISLHHNYIHHTGNEGFYIGNTSYNEGSGYTYTCTSPVFSGKVLPHKIIGVKVYENMCDSNGWDAIQVSASEAASIHDNYIIHDSYADVTNQQSGIMIGEPTQAEVYGNTIVDGNGVGIQCFGVGAKIYNNLIIHPGNSTKVRGTYNSSGQLINSTFTFGIYINDKVCKDASIPQLPYLVAHNTIVIDKIYKVGAPYNTWGPQGINANSLNYINGSFFGNNLIVIDTNTSMAQNNAISGIYSSNSVSGYSISNAPAFVSINSRSTISANYFSNEINTLNFGNWAASNYSLQSNSPAVDAAVSSTVSNNSILSKDLWNVTRPLGSSPDFGAMEYAPVVSGSNNNGMLVAPNPIFLSQSSGNSFTIILNDTSAISGLQVEMVGTTLSNNTQTLSVQTNQLVNGKRELVIACSQLPSQTGLFSVQVKSNGTLKAYANVMLLP